MDIRWLAPLPVADIIREAAATGRVLIVDETRRSGGVSEGIVSALVELGFDGLVSRVNSEDSFIPSGKRQTVCCSEKTEIDAAARALVGAVDDRQRSAVDGGVAAGRVTEPLR